MIFRNLNADEIEARISTVKDNGVSLLLYKDARCDMRVLDETVGAENWQREHYDCKASLFCRVGINVKYKTPEAEPLWVYKSDCGTESNTEAQKGEASDSFKRACFNWGIGRELYTAPFIWVPKTGRDGEENYKDKYDRYIVTYMRVENGKITALNIENPKKRRTVYTFGDVLTENICCVCGKPVRKDFAENSKIANAGKIYCSGTCLRNSEATP
ncbi:MAG: Rad52/Rad22 family DNA repair protein [Christensenella sp.]